MSRLIMIVSLFTAAILCGSILAGGSQPTIHSIDRMPLAFTKNMGQWDDRVLFRATSGGATLWFTKDGITYQFIRRVNREDSRGTLHVPAGTRSVPLRDDMDRDSIEQLVITAKFVGANPNPEIIAEGQMEYKCNYFLGNDASKWHTDVPNYEAITLKGVYPGIDVIYYGNGDGKMEYDFIISPGTNPQQIAVHYEGGKEICVDDVGQLVVRTEWGKVTERAPSVYQLVDGERRKIEAEYCLGEANTFGFTLNQKYQPEYATVIDPVLSYSTYLGGSDFEWGSDIAVDDSENAYVTGYTSSGNFPTQNPYQTHLVQPNDVFVSKLNNAGNGLIYSTYLGGDGDDLGLGVAVDGSGNAYVTGQTWSANFPTLNAYQYINNGGGSDVFVAKLGGNGNSLVYSTYLGGDAHDYAVAITVDASGHAYVTGGTFSPQDRPDSIPFPTHNPYQAQRRGYDDAFVTKLSYSGSSLVYSTYLGGDSGDGGTDIEVNGSGNAFVVGGTTSSDFPIMNPFQAVNQGGNDGFVTKLNTTGSGLIYSTYLGGSADDWSNGVALDQDGNAFIVGDTYSPDFPAQNSLGTQRGLEDIFVAKLNTVGNSLTYSTCLGGSDNDHSCGIAVDDSSSAYVSGSTRSTDFPTQNPCQASFQGSGCNFNDAFVAKFSSSGDGLIYSTYLGGSSGDWGGRIAVDHGGSAYVTGYTCSSDFPTQNPYQGTLQDGSGDPMSGIGDVFVAKLMVPIVPIVLVHGWTSNPSVWDSMVSWLHDDGHEYVWRVPLDRCGSSSEEGFEKHPERMYRGNAEILANYIDSQLMILPSEIRDRIEAIDIIAHSMGGLVARRYMAGREMNDSWTPKPVRNLIMLGTPNNGTGLAGKKAFLACWSGPAYKEMSPLYMPNFNRIIDDAPETEYWVVWGSGGYTANGTLNGKCCGGLGLFVSRPNDGVVADTSVIGKTDKGIRYPVQTATTLCHTDMPSSPDLYAGVVRSILQGTADKASSIRADALSEIPPQICFDLADSTSAGIIRTGAFSVEVNARASIFLLVSDSNATFSLTSPSMRIYDSTSTTIDSSIVYFYDPNGVRGFDIVAAEAGVWQWKVDAQTATASPVYFEVLASYENQVVVEGTQNLNYLIPGDTLLLGVKVTEGGIGLPGLSITVIPIWNEQDTSSAIVLHDDGLHADGSANDGTYGNKIGNFSDGVVEFKTAVNGTASFGAINRLLSFYAFASSYLCGDANGDGSVNISDAVYLIAYIFAGGSAPDPLISGDANCDGSVNISDAVYLIAYIFAGGPAPCE